LSSPWEEYVEDANSPLNDRNNSNHTIGCTNTDSNDDDYVDEELPFRNEPQIDEEQIDLDESNDDN
jgi:hypothetical protein